MYEKGTMSNIGVPSYDTFPTIDADGNPRIQCQQIDIGPYEIEGLANKVDVNLVKDSFKACPENSVTLQSAHCGTAVTYQWQQETSPSVWSNLQTNTNQTANTKGKYRVVASQIACGTKDTAYAWIENFNSPTPNLGTDRNHNVNDSLTLNAGTYSSYVWNNTTTNATSKFPRGLKPTLATDTTIWVTVTDNNGCKASDTIKLTIFGNLNINILTQLNIQVYPNPSSDYLNITETQHIFFIRMLDNQGRLLFDQIENFEQVNLSQLPKGAYIMHIFTTKGKDIAIKIIKE